MTIISTSTKVRILGQEMTLEERSSEISEWAEMLRQSSKRTRSQIRSVKDSPYAIDHSELISSEKLSVGIRIEQSVSNVSQRK